MRRVLIIQARMNSSRLPGKVLMELAGRPMLAQQLRRVKNCRQVDEIVVATTTNPADDPVVALAMDEGVRWFRGSESDVLSRYHDAALEARADVVARVTADCPLLDPEQTDRVIEEVIAHRAECDYAANIVQRTFPRGLDAEAFSMDTLERLHRWGQSGLAREHVTYFLLGERPDLFCIRSVTDSMDNSDLRWTVDTAEDLMLIRKLYDDLSLGDRALSYRQVVEYVRAHPALVDMNAHVVQKHPGQAHLPC